MSNAMHKRLSRRPCYDLMPEAERSAVLQELANALNGFAATLLAQYVICRALGEALGLGQIGREGVAMGMAGAEQAAWAAVLDRWRTWVPSPPLPRAAAIWATEASYSAYLAHHAAQPRPAPPERRRERALDGLWTAISAVADEIESELGEQVAEAKTAADAAFAVGEGSGGAVAAIGARAPWLAKSEVDRLAVERGSVWRKKRFDQAWRDDVVVNFTEQKSEDQVYAHALGVEI